MATFSIVKPCDVCGDIGVNEAIVICCECKVAREHLYCMSVFRVQIPEWWCCEECEQKKLSSPKTTENEPKTQNLSILMQQTALVKDGQTKNRIPSQFGFKEKWVDKGRTKYLSCDEAVKLSSGSIKLNNSRKEFGSAHGKSKSLTPPRVFQRSTGLKEKTTPSPPVKSPQKERSFKPNLQQPVVQQSFGSKEKTTLSLPIKSPQKERSFKPNLQQPVVQQSFGSKEKTTPFGCEKTHIKSPCEERNIKSNLQQPVVQQSFSPKAVKSSMHSRRIEGTNPEKEMKTTKNELLIPKKEPDISGLIEEVPKFLIKHEKTKAISGCKNHADVEAAVKPNPTTGLFVSEMHDPYIPSLNSYWKGCFYLPNEPQKFNEAFEAHPPSKTHYKVYETTKKLPESIYFELVSNQEIQAEIFPADRGDIGLYFFPMTKTSSKNDIPIIDFIWRNNLVMKSNVEGLELFVLSSRVLPSHAQEFKGNYFLWGVFRRPKNDKKVVDTMSLMEANCAPCDDVPPGFKRICRR